MINRKALRGFEVPTSAPSGEPTEEERAEAISALHPIPTDSIWISHKSYDDLSPPEPTPQDFFKPTQTEVQITIGTIPTSRASYGNTLHPTQNAALVSGILPRFQSRSFRQPGVNRNRRVVTEEISTFLIEVGKTANGLMVIILEGWEEWLREAFEETIPALPISHFTNFKSDNEVAVLPNFQTANTFSCVMDQVETWPYNPSTHNSEARLLGSHEARRLPTAIWCRLKGTSRAEPSAKKLYWPLIVLCTEPGQNVPQRIEQYYNSDGEGRRWKRTEACAFWIYLDLLSIFTNWDSTWKAARSNLGRRAKVVYESERSMPVLEHTRELYRDTATTIDLRESMRLHSFSMKHFLESIKEQSLELPLYADIIVRLRNSLLRLEYYDLTSATLLAQQENLLSLTFNTETVTQTQESLNQTQAVNRITALGFIFLPLSFVASIFGITTFTTSARWYPVAALPTMVITVVTAVLLGKIRSIWEKISTKRGSTNEEHNSLIYHNGRFGKRISIDRSSDKV